MQRWMVLRYASSPPKRNKARSQWADLAIPRLSLAETSSLILPCILCTEASRLYRRGWPLDPLTSRPGQAPLLIPKKKEKKKWETKASGRGEGAAAGTRRNIERKKIGEKRAFSGKTWLEAETGTEKADTGNQDERVIVLKHLEEVHS